MNYLIDTITTVIDKLLEAKGYALGKKALEDYQTRNFNKPKTGNVLKFRDYCGKETPIEQKEGVIMNKKPKKGSIKKLSNRDLFRGRFQHKGIEYVVTAKKFIDCFNKLEAKIDEVMGDQMEIKENKAEFNKNMLFGDWYQYWYTTYKEPNLRDNSKYSYETYKRAYLEKSKLFKTKLSKITSFEIQDLINSIDAPSTKYKIKQIISGCFDKAIIAGMLTFNPTLAVALPPAKKSKIKRTLEEHEVNTILNYCLNNDAAVYQELYLLYNLMLSTGCRIGEALALNWENSIDLKNRIIKIRSSYDEKTKSDAMTKTETSIRDIPIFNDLYNLLINRASSGYLFPLSRNLQTRDYAKSISKKLNINFTNHFFRHTFASTCLAKGINPKTIQKWMGHSKMDMTMNVYADVRNELEQSDINKFDS